MHNNKEVYMCRANASLSGIIGNTSAYIKEWFLGIFPKDTFKKVHVDTSMSLNNFMADKDNVFNKDGYPILVIKPRVTFGEDTMYGRLPDWISTNYYVFKNIENYLPVFSDPANEIYLYTVPDRLKITFEIEIICETKIQQINMAQYLKGSVMHAGYFILKNVRMEAQVPKLFIKCVHDIMDFDNSTDDGHAKFVDYLESRSQNYITEKINPSSSDPSYYYMYSPNLACRFEDYPQVDDGEQKDHVKVNFRISEVLTVDFSIPGNFFFETRKKLNPSDYTLGWDINDNSNPSQLVYTMQMTPEKYYKYDDGREFNLYKKQAYVTEENLELNEDTIPLTRFFNRDIKDVIDACFKYNIDPNTVFELKVYNDRSRQINPDNIVMDWNDLILHHKECRNDSMYHMYAYINYREYNKILKRFIHSTNQNYID